MRHHPTHDVVEALAFAWVAGEIVECITPWAGFGGLEDPVAWVQGSGVGGFLEVGRGGECDGEGCIVKMVDPFPKYGLEKGQGEFGGLVNTD